MQYVSTYGKARERVAANKGKIIVYWVVTLLMLLPTAGSGVPELFSQGPVQTLQSLHRLGYPLYLMKITGFAKILGTIALLVNRPARIVEWAYAGFTFLFLGATASHLFAGDYSNAPIPFAFLLLLIPSYWLHHQVRKLAS